MDANKALDAILNAEEAKRTYHNIREITGHKKDKIPLTQIQVMGPENPDEKVFLTTKTEMETAIIQRNQRHARQSLCLL
jgi:hypothetical protein